MAWQIDEADRHQRVLIMVSRQDHCLNDLLYRHKVGALAIDPVASSASTFDRRGRIAFVFPSAAYGRNQGAGALMILAC